MSGVKTRYITVNEREYYSNLEKVRRAEEERRRAEAAERAKKQFQEDLKKAKLYNKDLEDRIDDVNKKLDATAKEASDTKKQLIDTVKKNADALRKQSEEFDKKLESLGNDFADAMDENNRRIEEVIDAKTGELKDDISKLEADTKAAIDQVKGSISSLAKKVGEPGVLIKAGRDYLDIALDLVNSLDKSRLELFFPGELDKVLEKVEKAQKHIDTALDNPANASNALLTSEDAFDAAHKLYQDINAAEALWNAKLGMALEGLTIAQSELEAREKFILKSTDGKTDVELDTDFWSGGALESLKTQIDNIRDILNDDTHAKKLNIADLEGIVKLSDEIVNESKEVREGAISAALTSQERNKLAKSLKDELSNRGGLVIVDSEGYEGDDVRAANLIHLRNGTTGFEVVVTLKPVLINGRFGYDANTDIVNLGDNQKDAEKFDELLKSVMGSFGLTGDCPIPVNSDKQEEIKGWNDRETPKSVSKVVTNPKIITKVKDIKKKTTTV